MLCMMLWSSWVLLFAAVGTSVAAQKCSLCNGTITNTDFIIPQLGIAGKPNPTCQDAAGYAGIFEATDDQCALFEAQAAFCGCPGADKPDQGCSLCASDDEMPSAGSRETPLGDTCQELDTYLSFLSDCSSERVQDLQAHAFGCECASATAKCAMCPDGTISLANPDKVVPFISVASNGMGNPTCEDLALIAAFDEDAHCPLVQNQAGFCGCANTIPKNKCSFCPNAGIPAKLDFITTTTDTCQDLYEYMSYLDQEDCDSERAKDIQTLGFVCGCPDAKPKCTLCPDGSEPPEPDLQIQDVGPTCSQIAQSVAGLTEDRCVDQRKSILGISAARCKCADVDYPVCSIQQNPSLCTVALLDTADNDCECAAFCDGEFVTCMDYPGGLLSPQMCSGTPVAGCNPAMAQQNKEKQVNGGSGATSISLTYLGAAVVATGMIV